MVAVKTKLVNIFSNNTEKPTTPLNSTKWTLNQNLCIRINPMLKETLITKTTSKTEQLVINANMSTTLIKTKNIMKPCILETITISGKTLAQSQQLSMLLSANTYSTKSPTTTKPIKQYVEKPKGCNTKEKKHQGR